MTDEPEGPLEMKAAGIDAQRGFLSARLNPESGAINTAIETGDPYFSISQRGCHVNGVQVSFCRIRLPSDALKDFICDV